MGEALNPERMRRALAELHCPYCGEGPWKSVATHIRFNHRLSAAEVKEAAGIPRSHSLIAPSTRALLGERARERDSVSNMEGMRVVGKTAQVSEAGRATWRRTIKQASSARQKIRPEDHAEIKRRIAEGEMKRDIAADYGVSVTRIRQIEQGVTATYTKIASR